MYEIKYVGWIDAKYEDEAILRATGVQGRMNYRKDKGCFENCEVTEDIMEILIDKCPVPNFWPGAFTALAYPYRNEDQLPKAQQKYWSLEK